MKKLFMAIFVLSFSLLLSLPAFADGALYEEAIAVNTTMNDGNNTTRAYATNDKNPNWGWLGLAGLLGLAGKRNRSKNPEREH
ncbi:hypothetical protein FE783_29940 [Paenibacillus mesophilus]|uniref:WGxxGxxG family protein n=1 Tax=Paenibacillus mesophilus TaxID=2582849 RepID=UPI00110E998D|nr:WGxxGxxG family protein [Paenibacillus mesophilus]TMV45314.1 hypothetical protein FE783_29940 [Paenibacillus mesophilus]